jgi:uncharacterized coiled-coil DUF342 family protein
MNPNSNETALTMMINSLENKIEKQNQLIQKQRELIAKLSNIADAAREYKESTDEFIASLRLLNEVYREKIENGNL